MYIIELIVKKFTKKKEQPTYNPIQESETGDYESCEHTFMPIDSTEETLSCTKCGLLAKKSELKDNTSSEKNPFKNIFL
jgi:hypothetical protein